MLLLETEPLPEFPSKLSQAGARQPSHSSVASELRPNAENPRAAYVGTNKPYGLLERLIGEYVGRTAEARRLAH